MLSAHRRTWILLVLAALSVLGLFLGPDGWYGIDIGQGSAAVFYVTMWLFVIHLSRHPAAVFPDHASLVEKRGWVGLVFVTLITLHFANFLTALPALGDGAGSLLRSAWKPFGVNLAMLLLGWAAISSILRAQNAGEVERDERDRRIQQASQRLALNIMAISVACLAALLALFPDELRPWLRPQLVGNALIALLIAQHLAEHISLVARYQRTRI